MAVDEAAEVGHAIYATDSPASTGLFEASADHIFAGTFDLSAANRAAFRKTLGVMQMRNMIPQVVSQALQGFAACRVPGQARLLEMLVDARPAVRQQRLAGRVGPISCGGAPFAEQYLGRIADMLQRVIDVKHSCATDQVLPRLLPDPFGAVRQNRDRRTIFDSQTGRPLVPARTEAVAGFNGGEAHSRLRRRQFAIVPFFRPGGGSPWPFGEQAPPPFPPALPGCCPP